MNSTDYENRILDAIETITTNAINKAGYDKTIQATIIDLVDNLAGKYTVKYQDSEFEVFSNNTDIYYPSGTLVNVLIPNGDFNLNKTIVSAADKNQVEYTNIIEDEDRYQNSTGNTINAVQEFGLCSYKEFDECVLYDRDANENNINIDIEYIEKNIANKDSILCGAEFKTALNLSQQKSGNYGLVFDIDFLNTSTNEPTTSSFVLDIDQMKGDPYNLSSFIRQYKIFKINIDTFLSIKKIYLFAKNFPFQEEDKPNDIFAQNFELCLLNEIDAETPDMYELQIQTEGKKYFDNHDANIAKIRLSAKLQYKGRLTSDENIGYYWFKENTSITNTSPEYCIEGGPGWECLNEYNETENKRLYSSSEIMNIEKSMVLSANFIIKCVAVKNNKIIATQSFTIANYAAMYDLTITSEDGDIFYFDNGHPTLKCLINNEEMISENGNTYSYSWGFIDSDNIYHQLNETVEENEIYNTALAEYEELLSRLETGLALAAASQEELDRLAAIVNKHNQRVENNILHDIDLTKIVEKAIFKCTVVKNESIYLGTASFTITNKKETEGEYFIDILNGIQTFHYTVNGIAPSSSSLTNPIVLEPLKVILYDNNGQVISGDALNDCSVKWKVPKENTLIIAKDSTDLTLTYDLADNYDENKLYNNNIELIVYYKGRFLTTTTTFTFTKDGDPGINGTDIVCKIVPNERYKDDNYENNCYPMIVNNDFNFGCLNYEKTENYNYYYTNQWFKVQLWQNGKIILDTPETVIEYNKETKETHITTIKWSILRNRYNDTNEDETSINITKETVTETIAKENNVTEDYEKNIYHFGYLGYKENVANIVKAEITYNDVVYYAMLPVITVNLAEKDSDYSIELQRNTGFRAVKYNDSGKNPLYNTSTPFTIKVTKEIDGYIEDISTINNEYVLNYEWTRRGKWYSSSVGGFIDDCNFTIVEDDSVLKNQKFLRPNDYYTGENVTNAIEVRVLNTNGDVGTIYIPLYFYLDKFGHTEINAWDGNSISLGENGGFILAPEVGAGTKHPDGTFTGLLMGKVRDPNTDNIDVGLLGYYHTERTIFLDANTGKAEFGRFGQGKIIIDPSVQGDEDNPNASIYGGNFIRKDKDPDHLGKGLLIDLTMPCIEFGSEKFIVYPDGTLKATDAILSGSMNALSGTFGNGTHKIKIGENSNVSYSYIYSGEKTNIDARAPGFYLGTNGFAVGSPGENDTESPFKVTEDGILTAKGATIKGKIIANVGNIGNWYIDNGAIKYNNEDNFYLSNDGSVKFGNFSVNTDGAVEADGMSLTNGSIILSGSDDECRNGLIVGDFSFQSQDGKQNNARNCVGKDSFIARGSGAVGNFYYTKIVPDKVTLSNKTGNRKLEFDINDDHGNVAMLLTAPDDYTSIEVRRNNNATVRINSQKITAYGFDYFSCESKKKNITSDTGCLQEILNSDIMNFNYNHEKDGTKKHVGLIIPDKGGPYRCSEKALSFTGDSIDVASAVMMTWKALQEIQAQIDEIKGE